MNNVFVFTKLNEFIANIKGNIFVEKMLRYEIEENTVIFNSSLLLTGIDQQNLPIGARICIEHPVYEMENTVITEQMALEISGRMNVNVRLQKAFEIFMRRVKLTGKSAVEGFLEGGAFREHLLNANKMEHQLWKLVTSGNNREVVEINNEPAPIKTAGEKSLLDEILENTKYNFASCGVR